MNSLTYGFPLSKTMGKIRIKERLAFSDYGIPVAPTQTIITPKHYIEWQIGYDKVVSKSATYHFIGANGKTKQIYELSEFLAFGLHNGPISAKEIEKLQNFIMQNSDFIDKKEQITRSHFVDETINHIKFLKSTVSYPLLVYRFHNQDILCEIIVREKQYALGTMPMLYFCLPLSSLKDINSASFIGRTIQSNEMGYLVITQQNIHIFMRMFSIFGLLSLSHQHDCVQILNYLLDSNTKQSYAATSK